MTHSRRESEWSDADQLMRREANVHRTLEPQSLITVSKLRNIAAHEPFPRSH
jgi:hypothetical protein